MIKLKIICLGKLKEPGYKQLENEYLKRFPKFYKHELIELPEESYSESSGIENIKLVEWKKVQKYIKEDDILITLEEVGKSFNSTEFATFINHITESGKTLCFLLGSGVGLSREAVLNSSYTLSLSKLTFPHNMARLVLIEQLYRAGTILAGMNYHK